MDVAMIVAGPPIVWTGRAATCNRAAAVAFVAPGTLWLSAAGVTGTRAPVPPLSADSKADRSRIRFNSGSFLACDRPCIGTVRSNVQSKWYQGLTGATGAAGGGGASSFQRTDELHWLATGLFFLSRGGVKRPLAIM